MASSPKIPAEVIAALNDEQKAHLEQMMNNKVQSTDDDFPGRAQIAIRYYSRHENIDLYEYHDWSGTMDTYYVTFEKDNVGPYVFYHFSNHGISKSCMSHAGGECYWLVAWNAQSNQIYVKVAKKGPIDWNVIEQALDASDRTSIAVDPVTGKVAAIAHIDNLNASVAFYNLI